MDRWKAEMGRVREKRRVEKRTSEKRKNQKKEDEGARKGRKVAKHCVFPMISGSGASKSRLAKAAGAKPSGQMRDEKLHAVVAQSTFPSQNVQNTTCSDRTAFGSCNVGKVDAVAARNTFRSQNVQNTTCSDRTAFGSCYVEKVHAVVARSTFRSQNVQNTTCSDRFWKLLCRKSARRCGAKHISMSKCTKHTSFGPLLEVEMSKKCKPLWRAAHFEVKMYKTPHARDIWRGSAKMQVPWQARYKRHLHPGVAFWSLRSSGLLRWFCVTGAALRMTWHHFFVASTVV